MAATPTAGHPPRNHPEDTHTMQYLHTMVRISDIDESLDFYCNKLGLVETRRADLEAAEATLIFLAAPEDAERAKERRNQENTSAGGYDSVRGQVFNVG